MNRCVKCGCQIPKGELFCMECGLNPGSSLFKESHPDPVGRMQAPVAMPSARQAVALKTPERKQKNTRLKVALIFVSLLLVLSLGLLGWSYIHLQVEWNRLETRENHLNIQEQEQELVTQELETAQRELETLQKTLEKKEAEIAELQGQLLGNTPDLNQSQLDIFTMQGELDRLLEENKQLLLLEEELEANIKQLTTKVKFMDAHVVFVDKDDAKHYHTYDCARFGKENFWAYSRNLAEENGLRPCSTCGSKSS